MLLYTVSVRVPPPSRPLSLAVGDRGAAAQLDNHLLAVVKGPLVSQLLQGASGVGQHAHPLAGSRQEGGGKVAARQHHSLRLLALARPHLALFCIQQQNKKKQKKHTERVIYFGVLGSNFSCRWP